MSNLQSLKWAAVLLDEALAAWAPPARGRESANTAVATIDDMLRELHRVRAQLVGEIRAYDDATAKRVDAYLAGRERPILCAHADEGGPAHWRQPGGQPCDRARQGGEQR